MRITEIFQRCGDFTLTLDAPPPWLLTELNNALGDSGDPDLWGPRDGSIVVTNGRVRRQDVNLAMSVYTGILTERIGRFSFAGRSPEIFMGTAGVPGPYRIIAPDTFEDRTLNQVASQLIQPPFTAVVSYIGPDRITWTWPTATTYAELLDYTCHLFGEVSGYLEPFRIVWKVLPDFQVYLGVEIAPTIIEYDPKVIIGHLPIGDFAIETGVRSVRGTVTRTLNAEGMTHDAVSFGKDFGGGAYDSAQATSARPTVRDPVNGAESPTTRLADVSQAYLTTELQDAADEVLGLWERPRQNFEVSCPASANIRRWVDRGDRIWLYDPVGGVEDETNHQRIRGVDTFPVPARIVEIDYATADTDQIWLLRHNGVAQVWTEITPWVAPDTSDTRLVVTTGRAIDQSVGTPARFEESLAERLSGPLEWFPLTIVDLRQSATSVTWTENLARYTINGGFVEIQIDLIVTSAGVSGQEIILELDPTEWDETAVGDNDTFSYIEATAGVTYTGSTVARSNTTLAFQESGQSKGIGQTPAFALGAPDQLIVNIRTEVT